MTNYVNGWIKRAFKKLRKAFGGACRICGSTEKLQFAHLEPTNVKGRGRGRKERYYDIKNNPDSYILLCEPCHRTLDKILKEPKHLSHTRF